MDFTADGDTSDIENGGMKATIELPFDETLKLYYTPKVYNPKFSAIDTVVLAAGIIKRNEAVLDIATGSGVIALAIKKLFPHAQVFGSDINPYAIRIARKNAEALRLSVDFYTDDMLAMLGNSGVKWDIITANLPTFTAEDMERFKLNGPKEAYFADDTDGLKLYKQLFKDAKKCMTSTGKLICECQYKLIDDFKKLAKSEGWKLAGETGVSFVFVL